MLTHRQIIIKRLFDLILALMLLPILIVPIVLFIAISTLDLRRCGVFAQHRIGQYGKPFIMYKIRTLKQGLHTMGKLELSATSFGNFLRRHKLDELPQIFNVINGTMSFVGPRPDLPGFADRLKGEDRIILKVKPGITGPATLKYRNEEALLRLQPDPESYNRTNIWTDKVEINKKYVTNYSFYLDLILIVKSIKNK